MVPNEMGEKRPKVFSDGGGKKAAAFRSLLSLPPTELVILKRKMKPIGSERVTENAINFLLAGLTILGCS